MLPNPMNRLGQADRDVEFHIFEQGLLTGHPQLLVANASQFSAEADRHLDAERRPGTGQRQRDADRQRGGPRRGLREGNGQGQAQARESLHGNWFHALSPCVLRCLGASVLRATMNSPPSGQPASDR